VTREGGTSGGGGGRGEGREAEEEGGERDGPLRAAGERGRREQCALRAPIEPAAARQRGPPRTLRRGAASRPVEAGRGREARKTPGSALSRGTGRCRALRSPPVRRGSGEGRKEATRRAGPPLPEEPGAALCGRAALATAGLTRAPAWNFPLQLPARPSPFPPSRWKRSRRRGPSPPLGPRRAGREQGRFSRALCRRQRERAGPSSRARRRGSWGGGGRASERIPIPHIRRD